MPIIGQRNRPQTDNEIFNSLFENMTPERLQKINEIRLIRNNISNFVSRRSQIDKIVEIIDGCETFNFKKARNRKVSIHMPLFVMTWDWPEVEERLNYKSMRAKYEKISLKDYTYKVAKKFKRDEDFIAKLATKEILYPYANWMTEYLVNMDLFKEFVNEKFEIDLDEQDIEFLRGLTALFCSIFYSHILLNTSTYHLSLQF